MEDKDWFAHKDSNLDFQGQNLACYHYTMGEYQVRELFVITD